jgi:hypothetical protein
MFLRNSSTYDGFDAVQHNLNGQTFLHLKLSMVQILQVMHTGMILLMFACVLHFHHGYE